MSDIDRNFMKEALRLAEKGLGRTAPNPAVGAVVVRGGRVVGRGWHQKAGAPHAEVHALNDAGDAARGASIYITLEPCNHTGRTPPCTRAILNAGITRVVIGALDPNPSVAGGGMEFLRESGIDVSHGCMREECRLLVASFAKHARFGVPWVRSKVACSMDGRTATRTGHSKWITNSAARQRGHVLRRITDAILVGRGTVEADNPSLTCRADSGPGADDHSDPVRIVLDSRLSTDPASMVYAQDSPAETLVAAVKGQADTSRICEIESAGVEVMLFPGSGAVDIYALVQELGRRGIQSLLVEGGATVHGSFWDNGLVDEAFFFYAPVIIGGSDARPAVAGRGVEKLGDAARLSMCRYEELQGNWLVSGTVTDLGSIWGG